MEPEEGKKRQGENSRSNESEEEVIQEEEIKMVVKKMKKRKAAGVDGLPIRGKRPMDELSEVNETNMERRRNPRRLEERNCGADTQEGGPGFTE